MLNVSSPSPLYDDQASSNVSMETTSKKNTSMYGVSQPSGRPTLNNDGENLSNENLSSEENMKKITYVFKVILLGSISVGKTSILSRYITNEFRSEYKCTIKTEFKTKIVNINNMSQAKLNIWDTCGDEKFRAITRQYYNDAHGILLVYDITNRESFDSIINWQNEIRNNAPADSVLFLIANKTDLNKERVVTELEGKKKAEELGMLFIEVSAKNGDNIILLFENISEAMMQNIQNKPQINKEKMNLKNLENYEENDKNENIKKKFCC